MPASSGTPRHGAGEHRDGRRHHAGQEARQRPHDRDLQVGARRTRLAAQLGDTAEQPQGDLRHLDAVAACGHRVGQLVGEQRGHEQDGGDQPGQQVDRRRVAGEDDREPPERQPCDQDDDDDQHADVEPDPDSGDAAKRNRGAHLPSREKAVAVTYPQSAAGHLPRREAPPQRRGPREGRSHR
ncbi:hypothetical protein GCM10020001_077940 [Nonomuraea salmonea]